MLTKSYQHWRIEQDDDHIVWLYFDKKDASTNTINAEVVAELEHIVIQLRPLKNDVKAVVFASGKEKGFIAGADINMFNTFETMQAAETAIKRIQTLLDDIEQLPMPTIAMISGFCFGGGLELALACQYRIALSDRETKLGLPEVMLGIHPGMGGCVRLPRLIGAPAAMNLILSGRSVSAKAAKRLGFIDAAVPRRQLIRATKQFACHPPAPQKPSFFQRQTNACWMRPLLAFFMNDKLKQKISPTHYPAPFAAIKNWRRHGVGQHAMACEAKSIARLFFTDTCKNLVRVFFLQEQLKNLPHGDASTMHHVHVIGAGTMGGDIAAWCALHGLTVTLQDREAKHIAPALQRAQKLFKRKLKKPHMMTRAMDRLIPDIDGHGIAHADIIIEAVIEDLAIKQAVFKEVEAKAKPDAVLATNTSSIPLDDINQALSQPGRLIGLHFFNPVAKMQLAEVVSGEHTHDATLQKTIAFAQRIKRLPLPVKSAPGFLINRILMPYLLEAIHILEEGVSPSTIDKAALRFGMPMGPIELADRVGLDICHAVAHILLEHVGGTLPAILEKKINAQTLGTKTGQGFYHYRNGKAIKPRSAPSKKELQTLADRMIGKMREEAQRCLDEGIVANPDLLDAGMIFGTGFAPFRGGLHLAK